MVRRCLELPFRQALLGYIDESAHTTDDPGVCGPYRRGADENCASGAIAAHDLDFLVDNDFALMDRTHHGPLFALEPSSVQAIGRPSGVFLEGHRGSEWPPPDQFSLVVIQGYLSRSRVSQDYAGRHLRKESDELQPLTVDGFAALHVRDGACRPPGDYIEDDLLRFRELPRGIRAYDGHSDEVAPLDQRNAVSRSYTGRLQHGVQYQWIGGSAANGEGAPFGSDAPDEALTNSRTMFKCTLDYFRVHADDRARMKYVALAKQNGCH